MMLQVILHFWVSYTFKMRGNGKLIFINFPDCDLKERKKAMVCVCVCVGECSVIVINSGTAVLSACRQALLSTHNHSMTNEVCVLVSGKNRCSLACEVGGCRRERHSLLTCVYRGSELWMQPSTFARPQLAFKHKRTRFRCFTRWPCVHTSKQTKLTKRCPFHFKRTSLNR